MSRQLRYANEGNTPDKEREIQPGAYKMREAYHPCAGCVGSCLPLRLGEGGGPKVQIQYFLGTPRTYLGQDHIQGHDHRLHARLSEEPRVRARWPAWRHLDDRPLARDRVALLEKPRHLGAETRAIPQEPRQAAPMLK